MNTTQSPLAAISSSTTSISEQEIPEVSPTSIWSIHKTAEGKTYYYNKETKKSSWTSPQEISSNSVKKASPAPIEDSTLPSGWNAFKTPEG